MPKYTAESEEVVIDAPIELAWEILTDPEHYHEWNPFTPKIESDFEIGSKVELEVHLGKRVMHETELLEVFEPPNRIAWSQKKFSLGSLAGVTAFREQLLTKRSATQCSYKCYDHMGGPLTPLVKLFLDQTLRDCFTSVGTGLKQYAETRFRESGDG